MLLQQLGKFTSENHDDFAHVFEAASKIESVLAELNANLRKFDGLRKVVELEKSLLSSDGRAFELVNATRYHLHDGLVKVRKGPQACIDQERHVFVFNDLLIVAKRAKDKAKLSVEWHFTAGLKVDRVPQEPAQLRCGAFVFEFKAPGDVQVWLEKFKAATVLTNLSGSPTPRFPAAHASARASSSSSSSTDRPLAYSAESEKAPPAPEDGDLSPRGEQQISSSSSQGGSRAVVTSAHIPNLPGYANFPLGAEIVVFTTTPEGWTYALLDEHQGWIPATHYKLVGF